MSLPAVSDGSGAMFDRIATRYDRLNRILSFGLDRRWRRKLIASLGALGEGDEVLDLATGTADVALAVARHHAQCSVLGVDPSRGMLDVGCAKVAARDLSARVDLVEGDAQALDFADNRFAAACIAFGIRNVPDRRAALVEMARVVRPGGVVSVLELTEPRGRWTSPFARFHIHHVVPLLGALLSSKEEYAYLQASIRDFPSPEDFGALMAEAGLEAPRLKRMNMGCVHLFSATVPH